MPLQSESEPMGECNEPAFQRLARAVRGWPLPGLPWGLRRVGGGRPGLTEEKKVGQPPKNGRSRLLLVDERIERKGGRQ